MFSTSDDGIGLEDLYIPVGGGNDPFTVIANKEYGAGIQNALQIDNAFIMFCVL